MLEEILAVAFLVVGYIVLIGYATSITRKYNELKKDYDSLKKRINK